ncbi:kinase (plasmid) [Bosea vestrisii]|uniref:GHMP family kinase ATP-binding protein n=1 Tax=Bosea vestrisii TaxID=151416 RepID=UPI0024E0180D|nr:kinase [Bosea vestrisii]WID99745.1 kinase [Bosea vestrisii]
MAIGADDGSDRAVNEGSLRLGIGIGKAAAHHGEILQGVFDGSDGRLHRGLVTLPCPIFGSTAAFWPRSGRDIATRPMGREKASRAARLTLERLQRPDIGGDLVIESTVPMGHGYGSSTSDVVATIRAVASAARVILRPETIAALAVSAETASDPLAFENLPILFAQRDGYMLELLGFAFPPLVIVGCNLEPTRPVDTVLTSPARYNSEEIEVFRVLKGLAKRAISDGDAQLLGRVATASAKISQRHLPKPDFEALCAISLSAGADGLQVAHSGTLAGFLFDGASSTTRERAIEVVRQLKARGHSQIITYELGMDARSAR